MKKFVMNEEMKDLYIQALVLCEKDVPDQEELNQFLCKHTGLEDASNILRQFEYGVQTYKDILEHNGSLAEYLDDQELSPYNRRIHKALMLLQLQADADPERKENPKSKAFSTYKMIQELAKCDEDWLDSCLNVLHESAAKTAAETDMLFAGSHDLSQSHSSDLPYNSLAMAMVLYIAQENGYALTQNDSYMMPRVIGAYAACQNALLYVQRTHVISEETREVIKKAAVIMVGILVSAAMVAASMYLTGSPGPVLEQTAEQIALSKLETWTYTSGFFFAFLPFGGKVETWVRTSVDKLLDRIETKNIVRQETADLNTVRSQLNSMWQAVKAAEPVTTKIAQRSAVEIIEV